MPNHVISCVEILGDEETIIKMKKEIASEKYSFDCSKIIPYEGSEEDSTVEWCIENWGSKWGAYDGTKHEDVEILRPQENSLRFIRDDQSNLRIMRLSFLTAWSPITPVMEKLSEIYPSAIIKYSFSEEGNAFAGFEYFKGGKLVKFLDKSNRIPSVTKYVTGYAFEDTYRGFEEIYKDIKKIIK
jgi:hypothetical protein